MRRYIYWLAALALLGIFVTPRLSRAQDVTAVPPFQTPPNTLEVAWPFGRPHPERGGFYFAGEFMYWRQTNPLKSEPLGFRGVQDADGSIGLALGTTTIPGQFIGSKADAIDTNYVSGPRNYAPGFNFTFGYHFENSLSVEMRWIHLFDVRYSATASLLPPTSIGGNAEETFITSPVYNFSPVYFGPGNTTGLGTPIALFGIWDGSSSQTISFVQRFDQWEMTFRVPIQDSECWRTYGIIGPRIVSMWERFTWTVVHPETDGTILPIDVANYSNVTSNRLYGVHGGIGNEWFLGDSPAGAFALSVDLQSALFFDFMKGLPKYELGDKSTAAQHARRLSSFVPELDGSVNLWWYPIHGIQMRFGYEAMAFFNTFSSPRPVDFNFGSITPAYERTFRLFDGWNFGIGFQF
jgi:hypothetical protein